MDQPSSGQLLSVIVPCYNEQEVIATTHKRLSGVLKLIGMRYEIIYVDDGSSDQTESILRNLQKNDPTHVRLILFARNFGHQMAVSAGIDHAAGDAVVLIDADLQDPPEVIEHMLARWREGYQVAYGQRTDRQGESIFKLWTAKLFYRMLNTMSEIPMPLDTGDFRLMDRSVVDALKAMPERDRYIRGMVTWTGFKQIAVPYKRAARAAGESKYPLRKMIRFAVVGMLSFSRAPLHMVSTLGFGCAALSFVAIIYALAMRLFTEQWISGWTLLFIAVVFFGGIQLICLGIVGEYVGRIYAEVKRRPIYLVRECVGFQHAAGRSDVHRGVVKESVDVIAER
ncbi:glycosyltransferase family 2 protein [Planctomycetales bacterium ZRK34]|nr:glycosyltransferase family 2 protein [Planctomycetales bacterium ZRK34]